ncbi:MAG: DNA repair protein RadC [Nitrospinae bacterium]|nr:DNA repair protein RadC [Nitrospinota bacterium]
MKLGAASLSEAQLLAIALATGDASTGQSALDLARNLLQQFEGLRGLDAAGIAELCQTKGIGPAKATTIKAAFELGKRLSSEPPQRKIKISAPQDVVQYYRPHIQHLRKEVFKSILLDTRHQILKDVTVSEGSLSSSLVHPREAFLPAIKESAAAVIFLHNHPSGDPTPSAEDKELTRRLADVGRLVGITVLDHIIIGMGEPGYVSFLDAGLL